MLFMYHESLPNTMHGRLGLEAFFKENVSLYLNPKYFLSALCF